MIGGLVKEFREFAMRGNVIDLAVAVIIGTAFGKVVSSMVDDILMPIIGIPMGKMSFESLTFTLNGAVIRYGAFLTRVIDFLIVAFCIFMVVKIMNALKKRFEAEKPPAAPAGPSREEALLAEIRDLLKAGR